MNSIDLNWEINEWALIKLKNAASKDACGIYSKIV